MSYLRPVLVGAAAAVVSIAVTAPAASAAESLFVQQAASGKLSGKKLVLHGVSRRTVRFDDRPRRTGGVIPVRRLVRDWESSFGGVPPNAALVVHDAPRSRDVALLELRRPRYSAERRRLTFAIRRLRQTSSRQLSGFGRRADGRGVKRFGRAELFIDPSAPEPAPASFTFEVPGNQQAVVQFTNSHLSYDSDGALITNLVTPAENQGGIFSTAPGAIFLRHSSITVESSGAGGIRADVVAGIDPPPAGTLTGTATVPAGAAVTLSFIGETSHTIRNGPFSIPFPSG